MTPITAQKALEEATAALGEAAKTAHMPDVANAWMSIADRWITIASMFSMGTM
ncbi:hypothetical protein ACIBKY_51030 [Nonomuraea sp. NPDC050394]|uniref:hypothetical protein n=1 Tax=Nonomuraea sp. NPDC050394 TaxID=3364363 RepID=UPI0037AA26DA